MNKLWLVVRHEYRRHVLRRSFLVALLSVPVLLIVLALVAQAPSFLDSLTNRRSVVGMVDQAGVLADPAAGSDQDVGWTPFADVETATAALEAEKIDAFYILAADYSETRQVQLVYIEEPGADIVRAFREVLRVNALADQPAEITRRAIDGGHRILRSPDGRREFSGSLTLGQLLPALTGLALVALVFFSSGYLMQAVAREKSNRTMEILTTSMSAGQLMLGKVLGILAVTATQFLAWAGFAVLAALVGGQVLGVEWLQDLGVDGQAILLMIALVVPAYVMMAALLIAIAAALSDEYTGQQIVAGFVALLMTPMGLAIPLMRAPNGGLAVGFSLFPITSAILLPLRTLFVAVPRWQIATAVGLQSLLALGALVLAGRSLRLGMLRYGRRLHWREMLGRVAPQRPSPSPRSANFSGLSEVEHSAKTAARGVGKTLLVLRHELFKAVTKPMFVLVCIGVPLLLFVQLIAMDAASPEPFLGRRSGAVAEVDDVPEAPTSETQGVVDPVGLIRTVPGNIPPGMLVAYEDEASARRALEAGEIVAFHIIPADYVESGELITVRNDLNPFSLVEQYRPIDWALLFNLLGGDAELAARVWNPLNLRESRWTPATEGAPGVESSSGTGADDSTARFMIPMLIALLLYGVIVMASGLLLASVSDEKKHRVMEVLLLSVKPQQMLTGKIVALGIAGLLQAAVWGVIGYVFFAWTGWTFSLPGGIELDPSHLIWGAVFFLLGYAIYASLMAAAGALVPDLKESRMVSLIVYAPALVGFEIGLFTSNSPHGALSTGASLFPLTAPFTMMNRLIAGGVPLWQPLLATGLMVGTIFVIFHAVARMFHAQNLLSGQPFSVRRYFRALLGRSQAAAV